MPLLINEVTTCLAWAWLFVVILFLLIGFCVWLQRVGTENNDLNQESEALIEWNIYCEDNASEALKKSHEKFKELCTKMDKIYNRNV